MINPRGPQFAELLEECTSELRPWLGTEHDILFMASSGTGALEAAVANLLNPGEPALFCIMGWFGELWARIALALGVDVVRLDSAWGEATEPTALAEALDRHPEVRTVFLTHNETSTGVRNDLEQLAAVVKKRGLLLAIDSISGAPGHPFEMDELGADVVALGSQKGWLAPPGLAMVAVSPAALHAAASATCPRYYFDFALQKAQQELGRTHTTPPLSAMYGLREGLQILRAEGRTALWARHGSVAAMLRAGLATLGLSPLADSESASHTVTAVHSPFSSPTELAALLERLRDHYGVELAEGVGPLQGRSFRIGHLGAVGHDDIARVLDRLRAALLEMGLGTRHTAALAAA